MTISLWRLTHLWLALISSIFLLIASVTGAILSFEPVYEGSYDYDMTGADELTIAKLQQNLTARYPEISSIKRDHNGFIQVTIFDDHGENTFFVNPFSAERLGEPIASVELFDFCRTLHRSLFVGKTGRFLVGLTSVFLLVISITGFALALKKQGGLKALFTKTIPNEFYGDYHTKLGKLFILAIIIISITGGYLFLDRFTEISKSEQEHQIDFENLQESPDVGIANFVAFKNYNVENLQELIFPFADFIDEFYELKLDDRELLINQKTGKIESAIIYRNSQKLAMIAFDLHTGVGHPWWAGLLGITSISILFFIFSGFKIYFKRTTNKTAIVNPHKKEESDIIIVVGSEMGGTLNFAQALHIALLDKRKKSFLIEMNAFEYFPEMQYLIIVTSTYGVGEAPASATQFVQRFSKAQPSLKPFRFSVVGFGSTNYPDFCKYAIDVDQMLNSEDKASRLTPMAKVNKASLDEFNQWVSDFEDKMGLRLNVNLVTEKPKTTELKVLNKTFSPNKADDTFLLELISSNGVLKNYQSGDLMVIQLDKDQSERYYSMTVRSGRRSILLSVKRHDRGLVSNYLSNLSHSDLLSVSFKENASFHFPENANQVIMISNGTGIAPFIGMIENNRTKIPITLYWGGQNESSWNLYRPALDQLADKGYLHKVRTTFSRVKEGPGYVQDIIKADEDFIVDCLCSDANVLICGSLKMQQGVEEVLNNITTKNFNQSVQHFKNLGVIRTDCY
ncbi:MAG: PepSY domain-containing protein [Bacteroidota bacterium]